MIFDSRYFFTYLTPVTIYFVPPNDTSLHRDLFWEKADSKAKTVKIVLPCKNNVISRNHNLLFKIFKCILHERHCFANISWIYKMIVHSSVYYFYSTSILKRFCQSFFVEQHRRGQFKHFQVFLWQRICSKASMLAFEQWSTLWEKALTVVLI